MVFCLIYLYSFNLLASRSLRQQKRFLYRHELRLIADDDLYTTDLEEYERVNTKDALYKGTGHGPICYLWWILILLCKRNGSYSHDFEECNYFYRLFTFQVYVCLSTNAKN